MLRWQIGVLAGVGLLCAACGRTGVGCFGVGITIRPGADTVAVGDTARFTASSSCGSGLGPLRWQSSDTTIAALLPTVTVNATVVARRPGSASLSVWPQLDPVLRTTARLVVTGP